MYRFEAIETIHRAIIPEGIMASSEYKDNYRAIWSRDSMMTGIVGFLQGDELIIDAYKSSINTLALYQGISGQIPSNVSFIKDEVKLSYGSTVGRIDATTWWTIGACFYLSKVENLEMKQRLKTNVTRALEILDAWEINTKGLIYTPLGGNWADEYFMSGYTLYDNALRYWALKLAAKVYQEENWIEKAEKVKKIIVENFNSTTKEENTYHPKAYKNMISEHLNYLPMSFSANGYNTQWDMAGNALALILKLNNHPEKLKSYLLEMNQKFNHWMLPVFYPIVHESDWQWNLLKNNYSYSFKNLPYHFHNGGSWPIFLGWLCLGLRMNMEEEIPNQIRNEYEKLIEVHPSSRFNEYYTSNELKPKGVNQLCYSANGYLLMNMKCEKELEL